MRLDVYPVKKNKSKKNIEEIQSEILYSGNITHDLSYIAKEAEVYDYLWRPDASKIKYAEI